MIALKPDYAEAHKTAALCCGDLQRFTDALASYDKAVALKQRLRRREKQRCGIVLKDLERVADALASFDTAIALKPDYAEAYNNRGNMLKDLSRLSDALADFDTAIRSEPDHQGLTTTAASCCTT